MRHMPTLTEAMTAFPLHVSEDTSLVEAAALMEKHNCHHLPVMAGSTVVGVLTSEDIKLASQPGQRLNNEDGMSAADLCQRRFARVDLHTRLDVVLNGMADEGMDAVLVMRNEKLAGIFTSLDACRFFARWLKKEYMPDDDPGAA